MISLASYEAAKKAIAQMVPGTSQYDAMLKTIREYESVNKPATAGMVGVTSPADPTALAAYFAAPKPPPAGMVGISSPADPVALAAYLAAPRPAPISGGGSGGGGAFSTLPTLAELNKVPSTPVINGSPTNSIVGNRVLQDIIAPNTTTKPAGTIGTGGTGGSTSSGGSTGTGSSGSVTKPSTVLPTSVRPTWDPVTAASFNVSGPTLRNAADLAAQFGNINYDMNNIKGIFDNATNANYDALGKAYDTTQNQYYSRLYDNQALAMDTQRKMNASAVTSGASKGMQAATQLSGILGLQQTSAADSTALAQGRNALNDQRLAAMEKNTALAMTQAEQAKMDLLKNSQNLYAADTQFSVADLSARAQADLAAKQLQAAGITAEANMYGADQNMAGQIGYGNAVAQGQIESSRLSAEATRAAAASAAAAGSSYQAPLPAATFQKLYSDAIVAGDKASAIGYLMQTGMSYAEAETLVNGALGVSTKKPGATTPGPIGSTASDAGKTTTESWISKIYDP